jgi:hypothetical protein
MHTMQIMHNNMKNSMRETFEGCTAEGELSSVQEEGRVDWLTQMRCDRLLSPETCWSVTVF